MGKDGRVKIELKKDLVNRLIKLKEVGDSYSDVISRLLNESKKS